MSNTQRRTSPDPVGLAVLMGFLAIAVVMLTTCACSEGDALFDVLGFAFAAFCLACLRWVWLALRRWKDIHDTWKPPHHEDHHR